MILREQVGTGLREFHEGPAFMQSSHPRAIARSRPAAYSAGVPLVAEQERRVELFDVDAAILHRLEGAGVIHQATRGLVGSAKGRSAVYFIAVAPALLGPAAHTSARSNRAARAMPHNRLRCVSPKTLAMLPRSRREPDRTSVPFRHTAHPVGSRDRSRTAIAT